MDAEPSTSGDLVAGRPATIYSLHLLRGLAAILVMLYHYAHYLPSPPALLGEGHIGVDLFFVISGFVIAYTTMGSGAGQTREFALRRFWRVVPLAQLATLAYYFMMHDRPTHRVLAQSLLFWPMANIDPPVFGAPVVTPEWTLRYELFFYLIFAVALFMRPSRRIIVSSLLLGLVVVGAQLALGGPLTLNPHELLGANGRPGGILAAWLGFLGNPIVGEFIIGMGFAAAYRRWSDRLGSPGFGSVRLGLGIVLGGLFVVGWTPAHFGSGLIGKGVGAAALVLAGLAWECGAAPGRVHRLRTWPLRGLLWLGTISYPLYLVHSGIAERILRFAARNSFGWTVGGRTGFAALVVTAVLIASLVHLGLERPLIRIGRKLAASAPRQRE